MYPIGLQVLCAKIRGFHVAGATLSSKIKKSQKQRKNDLWNEKRRLGIHCRHHLVAYAILRGVPYEEVERCAPNNALDPQRVLDIVLAHNGWDPRRGFQSYDLERVKALLAVKEPTVVAPCAARSGQSSTQIVGSPPTPSHAQTPRSTLTRVLEGIKSLTEKLP